MSSAARLKALKQWRHDEASIGEQVPQSSAAEEWQIADVVTVVGLIVAMNACAYSVYVARHGDEFTTMANHDPYTGEEEEDECERMGLVNAAGAESRQRRELYTGVI